jgi:hypothetical protein
LLFKAVAGPEAAKGTTLVRVDHALTTWGEWKAAHADTRVLVGVAALRDNKKYDEDAFMVYAKGDAVAFPTEPMWSDPRVGKKTAIVATQGADGKWIVKRAEGAAETGKQVEAFLFAWYAMYPGSDFGGVVK